MAGGEGHDGHQRGEGHRHDVAGPGVGRWPPRPRRPPPPGPARAMRRPVSVTVRGIRAATSPTAHTSHSPAEHDRAEQRGARIQGGGERRPDGRQRQPDTARRHAAPQPGRPGATPGRRARRRSGSGGPGSRPKICVSATSRGYSIAQQHGIDADPVMPSRARRHGPIGGMPVADDRLVPLPVGLATSIGSLPHCDPGEAVDFVLRHQHGLPAAPSLPARSRAEGMIAQAACGVPGVALPDDGSIDVDLAALDPEAPLTDPGFSSDSFVGLRAFLTAVADRRGPIKVSLTGPVTFGVALHAAGVPAELAFRVSAAAAERRARALVQYVTGRVPAGPAGGLRRRAQPDRGHGPRLPDRRRSTPSTWCRARWPQVERLAITGLHCCGTADWRLLLQAGAQILSLPARRRRSRPRPGRWPASSSGAAGWPGARCPPTVRSAPPSTGCGASSRRVWCELVTSGGCDPARLRTQAMITPACGLYRHGVTQAEQVLDVHQPAGRAPARPGHRRAPLGRRVTDWAPVGEPPWPASPCGCRRSSGSSATASGASGVRASQPFGRVTAVPPVEARSGPGRRSGRAGRRAARASSATTTSATTSSTSPRSPTPTTTRWSASCRPSRTQFPELITPDSPTQRGRRAGRRPPSPPVRARACR